MLSLRDCAEIGEVVRWYNYACIFFDSPTEDNTMQSRLRYLRIEAFAEARKVLKDEQKSRLRKLMYNPDCSDRAVGSPTGMMEDGRK